MEVWELLDKEGNKTGETFVRGNTMPEGRYHLGADVWIVNSEGKFLIQKRSPLKKNEPNVWAMTGGSVIAGENSLEAIQREVAEELGLTISQEKFQLIKRFCVEDNKVWIDTYLLKQEINLEDVILQEEEVSSIAWASYEEIEELFQTGNFIKNRWDMVKDLLKEI